MRPLPLILSCLSLLACAVTTFADTPPPTSLRSDILYTHQGEFVQVKPMRPLTLNAHVEQFAYDPLGIEIAYVGSQPQGDNTLHFVKTVDVRTGHEISQFSFTTPADNQQTALVLHGWSTSGKFLMLQRFSPDPSEPDTAVSDFLRWDLSANPPTTKTINPQAALPQEQQSADLEGAANCYPSPDGRWLLFTQSLHTQAADGKFGPDKNAYFLYDPERDTFRLFTLPPNTVLAFWSDNSHLRFWQGLQKKQIDVVTGQISPLPDDTKIGPPAASKQYPDLSLDTEQRDLNDLKDFGHAPSCIIWIRRTSFGKTPLGSAAAAIMPAQANNFQPSWSPTNPQAAWSPTGKQVAFIANDDLYVTDLVRASISMPKEKLAVGLSLTCAEEEVLAESNLKEIGLGLIQFIQDNDENYPASGEFMEKVYPYIKTMDVFSVGGHKFVYEQPADLALSKMEAPAETENGYMDLPCARIVLFADGHVKAFPKVFSCAARNNLL